MEDHIELGGSSASQHSMYRLLGGGGRTESVSRATSPGLGTHLNNSESYDDKRYRPRTFPYFKLLPYLVEEEAERNAALQEILKQLYIAVKAEDLSPGAVHWTRELKAWLNLKFEITRELRVKLVKLYYMLALAPGINPTTADRFATMFMVLTKKKTYLKPGTDVVLDWRPLWKDIKCVVLPSETGAHQSSRRRLARNLTKFCGFAQHFFDPRERKAMFEEILPYFTTSDVSGAFIVVGVLNMLMPTTIARAGVPQLYPQDFLPTFFHLWSLVNRSRTFDVQFIDIFSRLAREAVQNEHVPFSEYGIFTKDQSELIFTATLRLSEIPVGQASSPYSSGVDLCAGTGVYVEKDKKKYPPTHAIARWIVMSLSPKCLDDKPSILSSLEGLIEAIDTFFHPSNQGAWSNVLSQFTYHLVDFFVMRWNREQSGEMDTPEDRCLTPALKRRFVICLKEVTFMGIFAKSSKSINYYLSALQGLAFLDPGVILPGALQRFYPSLQGLVEVHRTSSSLRGLQMIANTMSKQKGFRCHITALLGSALPGIDANDLNKTLQTLMFIQAVSYSVPFADLTKTRGGEIRDTTLAVNWIQGELERLEREGQDVMFDYSTEVSDEQEANILRSSTAGLGEFVSALLGKIFTLLENLPDAARVRSGSPEENVVNTLPAALTPFFASMSPELFDIALEKIAHWVGSHVVNQARDAMAFMCNALCKANPEKTLKRFIPMLIVGIRNEIDMNGAASDRSAGTDVKPRDRALVWHISMLSMIVVHVGWDVITYKKELYDIALYMQEKCKGLPTIHISNFIHHLLLNLTLIYPVDFALYEPGVIARGLDVGDWGQSPKANEITVNWHKPNEEEIAFAVQLFQSQAETAIGRLEGLMADDSPISRKGKNKEWSDEVSRALTLLRLVISGISSLFDPEGAATNPDLEKSDAMELDQDPLAEGEDEETRPQFRYRDGYFLDVGGSTYRQIHELRNRIGQLLTKIHNFLVRNQEDDVACFTSLYTTYKTWITDVGTERSAHTLDRVTKLYNADIAAFKVSGLRKAYPRALLIKRASIYNLQRTKHNATTRKKSQLESALLLDLAESSVSIYAEVRRNAQVAQESALKVLIGGRPLVLPPLLKAFRKALDENDHDRIKGSIYTLLFGSLLKFMFKDWRFAPDMMRLYIASAAVDKASIQKLSSGALYALFEFGRVLERVIILDEEILKTIEPVDVSGIQDNIERTHNFILHRRNAVEQKKTALAEELIQLARTSHWKIASRTIMFIINLGFRFENIAPESFIEVATMGAIDDHPSLRTAYNQACLQVFTMIDVRAAYGHEYVNYLLEKEADPNVYKLKVDRADPNWTQNFVNSFADHESTEYYVDADHPGWLVWGQEFQVARKRQIKFTDYQGVEVAARVQIGKLLTRDWYKKYFEYLKQEPRDSSSDRFRLTGVMLLAHTFNLMFYGLTEAKFEDIKELIQETFEDGSDKHQHRATAEIIGALLAGVMDDWSVEVRNKIWTYAVPVLDGVISDGLTPENLAYWMTCIHLVTGSKDPRRAPEIVNKLAEFRLDMTSNAAFKESSKIQLLDFAITDAGWHFRLDKPIMQDFLAHLDHPYKSVREGIGRTLATIFRTRYYEAFKDVTTLLEANKAASSIGIEPYRPSEEFSTILREVFDRLEQWRQERPAGQQLPSSYTSGSKTVMLWLDTTLSSYECTQLLPFFPDVFMEQLLHMMDVKEDPELQRLAYHVYRHLPNIPFRAGADNDFIEALIRIGKTSESWHQRLRTLINMQVIFFRRIFLIRREQQMMLFDAVSDMLADPQLEVRLGACSTLAGMIRCSPVGLRNNVLEMLRLRFEGGLNNNPMPKKRRGMASPGWGTPATPGTPTGNGSATPSSGANVILTPTSTASLSVNSVTGAISSNIATKTALANSAPLASAAGGGGLMNSATVIRRHAAVLGLGALVAAFPYQSPPPKWMPQVLALMAGRAAGDGGAIGQTVKTVLADFKKTRQDTWGTDMKVFTEEQLEQLEGVNWKSYFA